MRESIPQDDWETGRIREWLLALLRFAITLASADQTAVMNFANELDLSPFQLGRRFPGFFVRETTKICSAIVTDDGAMKMPILKSFIARIGDRRLGRVFAAALEFEQSDALLNSSKKRRMQKQMDLWKGL